MYYTIYFYVRMYLGSERPEMKDINNYVVIKCAVNWKQLGENLNLNKDLLNIIEKDNPNCCEDCCSKMLGDWLDSNVNASWKILLDAVSETTSMSNRVPEGLDTAAVKFPVIIEKSADKLPDTVEKLDTAADKLPDTVEKLDIAADKLPDTVEKLDTAADKLPDTVEKLDTAADKLPDTVEKLDTAADKLPRTVEKLGDAADKLPKAVDQLFETIPSVVGKIYNVECISLDAFIGNWHNIITQHYRL